MHGKSWNSPGIFPGFSPGKFLSVHNYMACNHIGAGSMQGGHMVWPCPPRFFGEGGTCCITSDDNAMFSESAGQSKINYFWGELMPYYQPPHAQYKVSSAT